MFGAAEDEAEFVIFRAILVLLNEVKEQILLVSLFDEKNMLVDLLSSRALWGDADFLRIVEESVGQLSDLWCHRGREEQSLALLRDGCGNFLNVANEAHVEHAVSFVEDEGVDLRNIDVALLLEIKQTADGSDEDIETAIESFDLWLLGNTAEDHTDLQA